MQYILNWGSRRWIKKISLLGAADYPKIHQSYIKVNCRTNQSWRGGRRKHCHMQAAQHSSRHRCPLSPLTWLHATILLPANELNHMIRNFWWGFYTGSVRPLPLPMEKMLPPQRRWRTVGIRDLHLVNQALLIKLGWRFINEPQNIKEKSLISMRQQLLQGVQWLIGHNYQSWIFMRTHRFTTYLAEL